MSLQQQLINLLEHNLFNRYPSAVIVSLEFLEQQEPLLREAWPHFDLDDIAEQLTAKLQSNQIVTYDSDQRVFLAETPPTE